MTGKDSMESVRNCMGGGSESRKEGVGIGLVTAYTLMLLVANFANTK